MADEFSAPGNPRKTTGIEVHALDQECVVYDSTTDRIHYLNPTAALVLEFCDGSRSPDEIASLVQGIYALPSAPIEDVRDCLFSLRELTIVA